VTRTLAIEARVSEARSGVLEHLSDVFFARPQLLTFLLLVPPLIWIGVVYIGSLFALLLQSFYALDDCGTRINPMIIEGQVHGGLTEAFAVAMGQEIRYDEQGNVMGASFMDFFLPTAVETPKWETDYTVTPSPHHPIGAKGVGESPHVGGVPCFSNAVNDAFAFLNAGHIQMPHDAWRLWKVGERLGLHV